MEVERGDKVEKGQIIAYLDDTVVKVNLRQNQEKIDNIHQSLIRFNMEQALVDDIEKFKLKIRPQKIKAQGAGPEQIEAQISKNNQLTIGRWVYKKCPIASIDLSPINAAFSAAKLTKVDGIIGAEVLKKGKAVIDYDKNYLYLK